jgi:hypothetical protein
MNNLEWIRAYREVVEQMMIAATFPDSRRLNAYDNIVEGLINGKKN